MSNTNSKAISIQILGKTYQIACPEGQEHELLDAAYHLDKRLMEIKKHSRVAGTDRVIIMGALNLTHELLQQRTQGQSAVEKMQGDLQKLTDKLDAALTHEK